MAQVFTLFYHFMIKMYPVFEEINSIFFIPFPMRIASNEIDI